MLLAKDRKPILKLSVILCFLFNIICLMETWYNNFQINNNLNTVFETAPKEKMKSVIIGKFNLISLNDDKDSNTNFSYKVI